MLTAIVIPALLMLGTGFFLGIWVISKVWPTCPQCGRALRCPVDEASDIRSDQVAAGPRPDRLAR